MCCFYPSFHINNVNYIYIIFIIFIIIFNLLTCIGIHNLNKAININRNNNDKHHFFSHIIKYVLNFTTLLRNIIIIFFLLTHSLMIPVFESLHQVISKSACIKNHLQADRQNTKQFRTMVIRICCSFDGFYLILPSFSRGSPHTKISITIIIGTNHFLL